MSGSRDLGRPDVRKEDLFSVSDYLVEVRSLAAAAGFTETVFARVGEFELPVFRKEGTGGATLYVSSGVHGDEPAGPLGLLDAFRNREFGEWFGWIVIPVLNPTGLTRGTRETASNIDLNRDYKILAAAESRAHRAYLESIMPELEAALGLHEDWEADGAYLYEHNPTGKADPSVALLEALDDAIGLQEGEEIDGWPTARKGLIHPPSDPDLREYWPEQIYLLRNFTNMSYTVETPSDRPLADRKEAIRKALRAFGDPDSWKRE